MKDIFGVIRQGETDGLRCRWYGFGVAVVGLLFLADVAYAVSSTANVGSATVDAGEYTFEHRMGYGLDTSGSADHKRLRTRQHIDYGWNGWYASRLVLEQDQRRADNLEHASVAIENRFQIFEADTDGWDGGFRINYGHRDGDKTPHEIDVRFLAQVPLRQGWEWRHNTVLEHDVGEDARSGVMLELRNQVTMPLSVREGGIVTSMRVGLEMFNDFGRVSDLGGLGTREHQFGPVVKLQFAEGVFLQTGYRAGLSRDSADHAFRLFVGRDF